MINGFQYRGFTVFQKIIRWGIALTFIIAFRAELWQAIIGIWNLIIHQIPLLPESSTALMKISAGLFLIAMSYMVFVFWLAHFVLPITKHEQRFPAFSRMLLHGLSMGYLHGPAVFVRDGEVQGNPMEFRKNYPGVAFLDLRSAMTLDKLQHQEDEDLSDEVKAPSKVRFSLVQLGAAYSAQVRTVGPGLTFIQQHERITGTVDLRSQSRTRKEVVADTRDGIRVKTSVTATFTLGQLPEILDVCLGGDKLDRVFVIEWEKDTPAHTKRISKLKQELGPDEETEVKEFLQRSPNPSAVTTDIPADKFPYAFDEKRVEQAVYSLATMNDPDQPGIKKWSDWPQDVAAEKFRILLSEYPYLGLYGIDETEYPMKDFKRQLFTTVRNTGVLAYRVVQLTNGLPPAVGEFYPENRLVYYPAQTFKKPAVLRDRGIKVINVNFSELEPKEKQVLDQLRAAWLASKKKEENLKIADYELEATRIINHARIRTHQNMNYHLAKILEKQEYPREALAMLVFQELEAAAANPETRKLLPENTLTMMNTIGQLLMQSQKDEDGIGAERSFLPPEEDK